MHTVYAFFRFYPVIALPLLILFFEIARYYRRRRERMQWLYIGAMGFLVLTSLLWVGFRGDRHSDQWVRSWFVN